MRTNRRSRLLKEKIKGISALGKITAQARQKGKIVVFTNGCFDILHYGHVKYLQDAKLKGDILVVAVNSDASVRRIKGGKRPIVNELDRSCVIAGLESVDYVTVFDEDTPLKTIEILKPNILVKGSDWGKNNIVGADLVLGLKGSVKRIKMLKGRSTTNLIKKIAETF